MADSLKKLREEGNRETRDYLNHLPDELGKIRDAAYDARKALEKKEYGKAYDLIIRANVRAGLLYQSFPIILLS